MTMNTTASGDGLWIGEAWQVWFAQVEREFRGQLWIDFVRDHAEIPIFAVSLYLGVVFYVPPALKGRKPLELRFLFAIWNFCLAVFSMAGASRTVPHLYHHLSNKGFLFSICTDPKDWYLDGAVGLWVGLFIFSKIPELLDTVFLVLQGKKVIFLHWFHHCTVMLYCWHAYHNRVAPGLWFATMNYMVHSIMYTYYFAMAARLQWLAVPFAPLITTTQILQMAVGSAVTFLSASDHWHNGPSSCSVDPANYKLGLAMYGSYLILFCGLFLNKYFGPKRSAQEPQDGGRRGKESEQLCGVDLRKCDTAGRFADFSEHRKAEKRD